MKIIQTLDIENNCSGIYCTDLNQFKLDGFQHLLKDCEYTWKHSQIIDEEKVKFLFIYTRGEDLEKYSKDQPTFIACRERLEAHARAAKLAKIDLENDCFFNLLPKHQLVKWFMLRQHALNDLLRQETTPTDYEILHKAHVLTETIARQSCHFRGKTGKVQYIIFGSVTGR